LNLFDKIKSVSFVEKINKNILSDLLGLPIAAVVCLPPSNVASTDVTNPVTLSQNNLSANR